MATGGGPSELFTPKGSTQSDKEEEEGSPAKPSLCVPEVLLTAFREFGRNQEGAFPLHCTLDPNPDSAHQPFPVVFTLTAVDSSNIPCSSGGESVQAFLCLRPPVPGPAIKAKVEDRGNGQYEVVFCVEFCGECELSVLVNGGHVRGSPFTVQLDGAVLQNGHWVMTRSSIGLGAIKGSLEFPQQPGCVSGIAVSPVNGSIFVSGNGYSKFHVFDVERKHVRTFGQYEKGEQQHFYPLGLDVSANGQLYVANWSNHCVNVLREDGTSIKTIGEGILMYPKDVLVHSSDVLCVADRGNDRIAVFSSEGELIRTFGSRGEGEGEFQFPSGIAVSPDDYHLYVSDQDNHRVQVFTLEGQYVREFGADQLNCPRGLTVTLDGSVLVADRTNDCVAVFDKKGELIHSFATESPTNLTVDSRGVLMVTSVIGKCVWY